MRIRLLFPAVMSQHYCMSSRSGGVFAEQSKRLTRTQSDFKRGGRCSTHNKEAADLRRLLPLQRTTVITRERLFLRHNDAKKKVVF